MKKAEAIDAIARELNRCVQYPLRSDSKADEVLYYVGEEIARCKRRLALLEALELQARYTEQPDYPAKKMDESLM